jgi:hypothetical protein
MNGNKETETLIETLMLDLVDWTIERERSCGQVMPAWRKEHAELPFWDEANRRGLIKTEIVNRRCVIRPTSLGLILSELRRVSTKQVRQLRSNATVNASLVLAISSDSSDMGIAKPEELCS